jgi:hypothetical protein
MKKIFLSFGIIVLAFVIFVLFFFFFIIKSFKTTNREACNTFSKETFINETKCTHEDILLFMDIADREGQQIRKWDSDIKVEIVQKEKLNKEEIADIDSIIDIIKPLIFPVKIYKVTNDGNFRIHRKVEKLPGVSENSMGIGCTKLNKWTESLNINSVDIYEPILTSSNVLLHEFLHGLGLSHPEKMYPFKMVIKGTEAPELFYSEEEWEEYDKIKYPLSEQEKQVLRMLYSSTIKSGLKIKCFKEKIDIK